MHNAADACPADAGVHHSWRLVMVGKLKWYAFDYEEAKEVLPASGWIVIIHGEKGGKAKAAFSVL
jgi:hypothetical protein